MNERAHEPAAAGPVVVGIIPAQPRAVLDRATTIAEALGSPLVCVWVNAASYLRPPGA